MALRGFATGSIHEALRKFTSTVISIQQSYVCGYIFYEFCVLVDFVFLLSVRRLLVTAKAVPSSPFLVAMMMQALSSSETSALTRATRCNFGEDDILHSYCRENLKSYKSLTGWAL
jgi:hypothetical protein